MKISGTLINYFFHCKRQCYLFAKRVNLEDNSEDVRVGKVLHEIKEKKTKGEVSLENIKMDNINKDYVIEYKKSDSDVKAAKMQLMLYLYKLKQKGINKKGKLEFFEKNKPQSYATEVILDENKLLKTLSEIENLLESVSLPKAEFDKKCKKCAYFEYCFI